MPSRSAVDSGPCASLISLLYPVGSARTGEPVDRQAAQRDTGQSVVAVVLPSDFASSGGLWRYEQRWLGSRSSFDGERRESLCRTSNRTSTVRRWTRL